VVELESLELHHHYKLEALDDLLDRSSWVLGRVLAAANPDADPVKS
jgi:hypothetical protein